MPTCRDGEDRHRSNQSRARYLAFWRFTSTFGFLGQPISYGLFDGFTQIQLVIVQSSGDPAGTKFTSRVFDEEPGRTSDAACALQPDSPLWSQRVRSSSTSSLISLPCCTSR